MLTSFPDLIIIGGVALLVFGPKRLPELAQSLGKGIRDFKRAMEGSEEDKDAAARNVTPVPPATTTAQKSPTQTPAPQA